MGRLQVNREFNKEEIANIVAFLKTLTGKQPDFKLPIFLLLIMRHQDLSRLNNGLRGDLVILK
jgi:hypothetical protein